MAEIDSQNSMANVPHLFHSPNIKTKEELTLSHINDKIVEIQKEIETYRNESNLFSEKLRESDQKYKQLVAKEHSWGNRIIKWISSSATLSKLFSFLIPSFIKKKEEIQKILAEETAEKNNIASSNEVITLNNHLIEEKQTESDRLLVIKTEKEFNLQADSANNQIFALFGGEKAYETLPYIDLRTLVKLDSPQSLISISQLPTHFSGVNMDPIKRFDGGFLIINKTNVTNLSDMTSAVQYFYLDEVDGKVGSWSSAGYPHIPNRIHWMEGGVADHSYYDQIQNLIQRTQLTFKEEPFEEF